MRGEPGPALSPSSPPAPHSGDCLQAEGAHPLPPAPHPPFTPPLALGPGGDSLETHPKWHPSAPPLPCPPLPSVSWCFHSVWSLPPGPGEVAGGSGSLFLFTLGPLSADEIPQHRSLEICCQQGSPLGLILVAGARPLPAGGGGGRQGRERGRRTTARGLHPPAHAACPPGAATAPGGDGAKPSQVRALGPPESFPSADEWPVSSSSWFSLAWN